MGVLKLEKEKEYEEVLVILQKHYEGQKFWLDDGLVNETIKAMKKIKRKRSTR